MSSNILSLLGIAQKARILVSGQDTVGRLALLNKVFLIIVAEDSSSNTKKKMVSVSKAKNIPLFFFGKSDQLSHAIGKENRKVIGIIDRGFAKELLNRFNLLTGVGNIDEN